ncbi:uncharacterized protein TrAFT101_005753 [Trichoderma asperellum]|uniref:Uncharacterized protein n=1 Tax=Trichoderma asperellum (strain ATCC 204424 / CBS 433.97 / NBRC 101777) TaxID=1042311 RepID=A0A2T3Z6Y1_TRIA4|nr:hypothetical protein M441DRAFT_27150 [Trichoderma asperellum CBS 433.97]PTB40573.1 hypothetical protein M441DRAFT_27150 [Trichoderma asperellum CBS 433.97]UKZ90755.1 hypothetical protein TrAFT101_005753 [Trichoderma asperellum]
MLGTQSPSSPAPGILMEGFDQARQHPRRKRKAESQDNERLSKRLSLLNIEQDGSKLYVPVETPSANANAAATSSTRRAKAAKSQSSDETMQLDDSKHKVYIYDLDAELSSDSDNDEGKLIFLPDIQKHLKENRIPRQILANDEGELAGMQLVLYSDPKSISVPESQDGVRRAIIEARRRARDRQKNPDTSEMHNNTMASETTTETMSHVDPAPANAFPINDACDDMDID